MKKILLITYSRALNAAQYIEYFKQHQIECINLNHKEFASQYDSGKLPKKLSDEYAAVICLLVYRNDKRALKILESQDIRVFNPMQCIKTCDDKYATYLKLEKYNILQPKSYGSLIEAKEAPLCTPDELGNFTAPIIVKTIDGSFGEGTYLCSHIDDLQNLVYDLDKAGKKYLIQEYIESSSGKDITSYVIGGKFQGSYMRENSREFRSHVCHGGQAKTFELNKAQQELSEKIANIIGADLCSINFLLGENGELYVCEVNARPSCQVYKEFSGTDIMELYLDYIKNKI